MSRRRWLEGSPDPVAGEVRLALDDAQARTGDDVALRRIWSKVSQATSPVLRPRALARWRWFVGGVVSSAGLAAVLAVAFWPVRVAQPVAATAPAAARPIAARASALLSAPTPAPTPAPASARRLVMGPTSIEAAAGEALVVQLAGGVGAALAPHATLAVDEQQAPTVLYGSVHFSVPHQAPGRTFVVAVAGYRVVVVGTKFRIATGARVAVEVDEGMVEVWREKTRLARLAVGESWSGAAVPPLAAAESAPLAQVPAPGAPPAVSHRARIRRAPATIAAAVAAIDDRAAGAGGGAPHAAEAEGALAAGDVHRSLELYGEILARGGPAAENAAYEIGKILRDRLLQPEAAVAAWRRYRDQNENGVLRVEADVSIIETLVQLGDREGALAEASQFLRRHPDSERRGEIARIAGDLQRSSGDCRSALRSYDLALQSQRRALAEAASQGRAACIRALKDGAAF